MSKAPSDEKQLVRDPVGTAPNTATSRRLLKYMCDACEGALPGGGSFVSVIDAIQGDGSTRSGRRCNSPSTQASRQLTSDDDVQAAPSAGEITLMPTQRGVSLRGGGTEALMTEAEEAAKGWPDEKQGVAPA
jgi:hypothetical protein